MNKKTIFLITTGALILTGYPFSSALAQLHDYGGNYSLTGIITGLMSNIWLIFSALAVIMFLMSGIQFLTAQGEPEKVKTAKQSFIWGIVGVVIGIISYSIIKIVGSLIS